MSVADRRFITTCTPLRISFAGGGTDLPEFYERSYGAVYSSAINKLLYVTVKPLSRIYGNIYRLNYSIAEQVENLDDIKNSIARECIRLVPVDPPIYIGTIADLPASSGLGSSSSFAVGLLNALHAYRNERVAAGQIAEEAAQVEIDVLGHPIGKQDQFAAAYGGINYIRFMAGGRVSIEPQPIAAPSVERLFASLMLMWTGIHRESNEVLHEQKTNTPRHLAELETMRDQALEMRDLVANGCSPESFGALLHAGWRLKRGLASQVSNGRVDAWYARARAAGALGGKLCGAGGGGFLLLVVPPDKRPAVTAVLPELTEVSIGYEPQGSRVLVGAEA